DASRAAAIAARHGKLQMAFHARRFTGTAARRTCCLSRTCRPAGSLASSTPMHSHDGDAGANPADRLIEADGDWIFQILTTLRGTLILARKNIFKDFAKFSVAWSREIETLKLKAPIRSGTRLF